MTEIYLHFKFAHYGLSGNAPVGSVCSAPPKPACDAYGLREFRWERCWRDFVRYANTSYRDAYIQAFLPANGVLECQGPLEGGVCAQYMRTSERASERSHSMSLKPTHVSP